MAAKNYKVAFFGAPEYAVRALEGMKKHGVVPKLVITAPDKPQGRGLVITPPPAKIWAGENSVQTFQPETLNGNSKANVLYENDWDFFVVAAYGKILTKELLELPKYGALNIHPSLLPRLRGVSPIQTAILEERETGVTVIKMDEQIDHGPIYAQEKVSLVPTPKASELGGQLFFLGGELVAQSLNEIASGRAAALPQDHSLATYTKKITKEDGFIDLNESAEKNFRKIQAYDIWPRTYFFAQKNGKKIRVIITLADLNNGKLEIKRVIPEGKGEMDYKKFTYL